MSSMPNLKVFEPVSLRMVREIFDKQKDFAESLYIRLANCNLYLQGYSELPTPPLGELAVIVPIKPLTKKVVILQGAVLLSEVIVFCISSTIVVTLPSFQLYGSKKYQKNS